MRPSSAASTRASHMGAAGGLSSTARLMEKKKEYEAVLALDKVSAELVERLEALGDDCQIMADAGEIHGSVLEHWSRMFGIINLVVCSREAEGTNAKSASKPPPTAERLVRLEIAALEQVDHSK
ncbi:hypothetical protein BU17DRAFT_79253 [Hysterangium stoloniferum]|nr:hypothetical protein BU17DRAFT_79253 [Hysterangium stoloniferum]